MHLLRSASLLLHHPVVHLYKKDRNNFSRKRCSSDAESILDIVNTLQNQPDVGNYILPHPLVLAARVRLSELIEKKGHYRGRDMQLILDGLNQFGRNWGLQGSCQLLDYRLRH